MMRDETVWNANGSDRFRDDAAEYARYEERDQVKMPNIPRDSQCRFCGWNMPDQNESEGGGARVRKLEKAPKNGFAAVHEIRRREKGGSENRETDVTGRL